MAMVRAFFTLILLSGVYPWQLSAQQFSIVDEPVCWTIGAIDSNLTRAYYVSVTGHGLTVFYINEDGASVDVSAGGLFSFGKCNCCADVPPSYASDAPYIDTLSIYKGVVPVPPTIDSLLQGVYYAEIENITDVSQITATFSAATLPVLTATSPGYYTNAAGAINYTSYTQLTPTRAAIVIGFTVIPFPPNSSYIPIPVNITAVNNAGSVTIYDDQFF